MKSAFSFLILILAKTCLYSQIIFNDSALAFINTAFTQKKILAQGRYDELFGVFSGNLTLNEKQAMQFLYAYMPLSDLADYNGQFFLDHVRMSLKAKKQTKWGASIPEDVFLHFTLPLRVNNERLDSFRISMFDEIMTRIKGLGMKQAALEINHWCHEKVTYRPSDERTSSPLSTMRYSFGRCGEESTFTVAALRTAGIPARQVYTPRWAHTDDNHAWVEVWVDGQWYFMGACEPEPDLNMGWFALPATRTILVHTRAYGRYYGSEPVIDNSENFAELNLIRNYAPFKTFAVLVRDKAGKPVDNARVEFQLYNYAEFFPLARKYTGKEGMTTMTCGLGDLLVWADKDDDFAYSKITVGKTDTLKLVIEKKKLNGITEQFDLVPPPEGKTVQPNEIGKAENNRRLRMEDSLRSIYMSTFRDTAWAKELSKKLQTEENSTIRFITKSYGNWKEISGFLEMASPAQRPFAMRILATLTDKDLRDAKETTLYDHLISFYISESIFSGDRELFDKYVLSPRIMTEYITPWRSFLQKKFGEKFAKEARNNILYITEWIKNNIRLDDKANAHSRVPMSPCGVYELKVADKTSRDILFVAICRSFCIPARINTETRTPQYYDGKMWINIDFESLTVDAGGKSFIHLYSPDTSILSRYYTNYTLARFKNGHYRTLEFDEGKPLNEFPDSIEVAAGKYMVVTGNRQHNGSVLAHMRFFDLADGQFIKVAVEIRQTQAVSRPMEKINPDGFSVIFPQINKEANLKDLIANGPYVIVYLDEKEPSKHILNDLAMTKQALENTGCRFIFILPEEIDAGVYPSDLLKKLPESHVFVKQGKANLITAVEQQTGTLLSGKLPLVMVFDKNNYLLFLTKGYMIGAGEQVVNCLKK